EHGLRALHFSDFEVVDLTPIVRNLSVHNGDAGTRVTVIGQNFSGAAGRLQVLFGRKPATSVSVVDDNHVIATAPAGSGTVDVRVQSGEVTDADPENSKSPLFGSGVSAVAFRGRFTYGPAPAEPDRLRIAATPGVVDPSANWYLRSTTAAGAPD